MVSVRALYEAGFLTISDLAHANPSIIEMLLKKAVPFRSSRQAADESEQEAQDRQSARCIWTNGKQGLTEKEAALQIVAEAQLLLQHDLALLGVQWNPESHQGKPQDPPPSTTKPTRSSGSLLDSPKRFLKVSVKGTAHQTKKNSVTEQRRDISDGKSHVGNDAEDVTMTVNQRSGEKGRTSPPHQSSPPSLGRSEEHPIKDLLSTAAANPLNRSASLVRAKPEAESVSLNKIRKFMNNYKNKTDGDPAEISTRIPPKPCVAPVSKRRKVESHVPMAVGPNEAPHLDSVAVQREVAERNPLLSSSYSSLDCEHNGSPDRIGTHPKSELKDLCSERQGRKVEDSSAECVDDPPAVAFKKHQQKSKHCDAGNKRGTSSWKPRIASLQFPVPSSHLDVDKVDSQVKQGLYILGNQNCPLLLEQRCGTVGGEVQAAETKKAESPDLSTSGHEEMFGDSFQLDTQTEELIMQLHEGRVISPENNSSKPGIAPESKRIQTGNGHLCEQRSMEVNQVGSDSHQEQLMHDHSPEEMRGSDSPAKATPRDNISLTDSQLEGILDYRTQATGSHEEALHTVETNIRSNEIHSPPNADREMVENAAENSINRSSSFLFDSLNEDLLLDSPTEGLPSDDVGDGATSMDTYHFPSVQVQQEDYKNQANDLEAIQWGESLLNLSEWGDSLQIGELYLNRLSTVFRSANDEPLMMPPTVLQTETIKPLKRVNGIQDHSITPHRSLLDSSFHLSPGMQDFLDQWPSMSAKFQTSLDALIGVETDQNASSHAITERVKPTSSERSVEVDSGTNDLRSVRSESPCPVKEPESGLRGHNDLIPPTPDSETLMTKNTWSILSAHSSPIIPTPLVQTNTVAMAMPEVPPINALIDPNPNLELQTSQMSQGLPQSSSSLSSSLNGFAIIDVASDYQLFKTFIQEWKTKRCFSIALACERKERMHSPNSAIGGKFQQGETNAEDQGSIDGFPLRGNDHLILTGMSICWGGKDAYYVSLLRDQPIEDVSASLAPPPLDESLSVGERMKQIHTCLKRGSLSQADGTVITYDFIKLYKTLLMTCGLSLEGNFEDPKVACWLLDPGSKERTLHNMVTNFSPSDLPLLEGISPGQGIQSLGMDGRSGHTGRYRAAIESVLVFSTMTQLTSLLEKEGLLDVFRQVEMPALYCLALLELNGVGFSTAECDAQKNIMQARLRALESQAYQLAGHTFSLTSPDDIAQVLFLELKLPPNGDKLKNKKTLGYARRTAGASRVRLGKQFSTTKDVLEKLKTLHPLPGVILEWRRITNALTKVVFPLQREKCRLSLLDMDRIYPIAQIHTATGRVSFTEPNIQNVPKDFEIEMPNVIEESPPSQERGRPRSKTSKIHRELASLVKAPEGSSEKGMPFSVSMRHAFVPFPGGLILAADYSQLELRILAHLSRDRRLLLALNSGTDVFRTIAAEWRMIKPEDVDDNLRQLAKQICYGIIYGMGAKSLGEQMGIEENDAASYIETFKSRYSGIHAFLKETVKNCTKQGYVQTILGRRRFLPAIKDKNVFIKSHAERQAVNTTVQGSAADIVKSATVGIQQRLEQAFSSIPKSHGHASATAVNLRRRCLSHSCRGAFFVLQLHDELIYEVAEEDVIQVAQIVKKEMESVMKLYVKLRAKIRVGPSWRDLQDLDI
ncbi:hypothetical protein GJAV_G00129050 [Gymnothorax javanicus]|nr:hypothetical protein GJAV_G00129050 [Gymnothorax javanicus]